MPHTLSSAVRVLTSNDPFPAAVDQVGPGDSEGWPRLAADPRLVGRPRSSASNTLEDLINHINIRLTPAQVLGVEVDGVYLVLHQVDPAEVRRLEERKILVAEVGPAAPDDLVGVDCHLGHQIV